MWRERFLSNRRVRPTPETTVSTTVAVTPAKSAPSPSGIRGGYCSRGSEPPGTPGALHLGDSAFPECGRVRSGIAPNRVLIARRFALLAGPDRDFRPDQTTEPV